ncbi:MFS transporter [Aestuariispira ectoiniformans]|uniref:MFS transporter n=1 Tax=Aestuariispira ectoiniformans TaxID=2775080 RepID=UPI00223BAA4E|nr:MFS transporter [Aestuariispira ectoiniformans]
MHVRHPIWLRKAGAPGAEAFAILFTFESFARATMSSVLPLDALRYLGDASSVSSLYFLIGLVGIACGFCVPLFIQWTARRWVYTGGALILAAAPASMMAGTLEGQIAGMLFRVIGTVTLTICLNLYVLDYIAKHELSKAEPKRVFYSAVAWTTGPALGTFLYTQVAPEAAYATGLAFALISLTYFWRLRLSDKSPIGAARRPAPNPLANIGKFLRRPRLVLGWIVALGRSSWWAMLFIYTPIFAVQTGLGAMVGGMLVSTASGFLFLLPLLTRFLRAKGLRRVLTLGFAGAGLSTAAIAATIDYPYVAVGFLLLSAVFVVLLDLVGNMTFLLAVKPGERSDMTSVYATYRDVAEISAPGVFSIVLRSFDLAAVYLVTSFVMLGMARLAMVVHPRLGLDRAYDSKYQNADRIAGAAGS